MRRIQKLALVLACMYFAPMVAENHFVYFTDGRLEVYPHELVKELQTTADGYALTLINDSVISWTGDEVERVSNEAPQLPQLTEFEFDDKLNEQLVNDVPATIADGRVTATVAAIGKYLTPTFKTDSRDAVVYVDGVEQVSGQSRRRFADEVVYTLSRQGYSRFSMEKVKEEVWSDPQTGLKAIPLTEAMLSTNAPTSQTHEGLGMMLDGEPSTIFHSTWSADAVYEVDLSKQVYIEVALPYPISALQFYYAGRTNTDRYNVQEWRVEASADGKQWNEVATLDESKGLPVMGSGITYTSPEIELGGQCSYVRFTAVKVGYKNYLCISELRLYEVTGGEVEPELISPAEYAYRMVPYGREMTVAVDWLTDYATAVPRVDIDIDGGQMVSSKDYYLNAQITIQGNGVWADFQDSVQIKGRGNSSWSSNPYAKNPYRLKFAESVKPFGLKKGKNWNLIAQAQTGSMMSNAMAMKMARMVGAAGANDVIPVDLYMNGMYRGSYIFTQKTGLANNSIDLDDESAAVFLELDSYYDEVYRFKSDSYRLPVNIKEPDFSEGETILSYEQTMDDFNAFETALYEGTNFERFVDVDKLVRFMLVNELALNTELNHPKSVFLHKESLNDMGSRYTFGPVWDFDWGYGYESVRSYCTWGAESELFSYLTSGVGNRFFSHLWKSSDWVKYRYYELWTEFMEQHLQELIDYVDDYYAYAAPSFRNNASIWSDGNNYAAVAEDMKEWLTKRAHYIMNSLDTYELNGLIDYPFGDVNVDKRINARDLELMLVCLKGIKPMGFNSDMADIDADAEVSVADLAWLCQLIENESGAPSVLNLAPSLYVENGVFDVAVDEVTEGLTWELDLSMANMNPYVAFQMDVTLPEGIGVFDDETSITLQPAMEAAHAVSNGYLTGSDYRIVGYSPTNAVLSPSAGALLTLTLEADRVLPEGRYPIAISNIRVVSPTGEETTMADVNATLKVSIPSAIATPTESACEVTYYTPEGKQLDAPRSGIVICRKVYSDGRVEVEKRKY